MNNKLTSEICYPNYGYSSIGAVMQSALGSLGINHTSPTYINSIEAAKKFNLPSTKKVCVILVDGLGYNNIIENIQNAPFLKSISDGGKAIRKLTTSFPSTTAAALSTLMTSTCPGLTGILGYTQYNTIKHSLMYMLKWVNCPRPQKMQQNATVFETLSKNDIDSAHIGLKKFKTSKFTKAITKKSKLVAANNIDKRIELAKESIKNTAFTYLYIESADLVSHKYGYNSPQWIENLKKIDDSLKKLYEDSPKGTLFLLTADHGAITGNVKNRTDIKDFPILQKELTAFAGEARAVYLYTKSPETVAKNYTKHFGDKIHLFTRNEMIEKNLFGPISNHAMKFLPDLVVVPSDNNLIVNSNSQKNRTLEMVGYHGGLSPYEMEIPLLSFVN